MSTITDSVAWCRDASVTQFLAFVSMLIGVVGVLSSVTLLYATFVTMTYQWALQEGLFAGAAGAKRAAAYRFVFGVPIFAVGGYVIGIAIDRGLSRVAWMLVAVGIYTFAFSVYNWLVEFDILSWGVVP
jgi:hypothetical protein